MEDIRPALPARSDRFMHRVRRDMRERGYAYRTERTYCHWIKRFIYFHNKRHPELMGVDEINAFLSYLAVRTEIYTHVLRRGPLGVISPLDG